MKWLSKEHKEHYEEARREVKGMGYAPYSVKILKPVRRKAYSLNRVKPQVDDGQIFSAAAYIPVMMMDMMKSGYTISMDGVFSLIPDAYKAHIFGYRPKYTMQPYGRLKKASEKFENKERLAYDVMLENRKREHKAHNQRAKRWRRENLDDPIAESFRQVYWKKKMWAKRKKDWWIRNVYIPQKRREERDKSE